MLISAIVMKDELVAIVESLTPLHVVIDARRGRSVTFGRLRLKLASAFR